MKINKITISISESELDIIGEALEGAIKKSVELFGKSKYMYEEEISLLHDLTNLGYKMWINPIGKVLDGRACHDVQEWLKYVQKTVHNKNKGEKK